MFLLKLRTVSSGGMKFIQLVLSAIYRLVKLVLAHYVISIMSYEANVIYRSKNKSNLGLNRLVKLMY